MSIAEPETSRITAEQAREMGFSEEELDDLLAAGVLVPEERRGPWVPTSLEDVDWIIARRKQLDAERADLERWHRERLARSFRAQRALSRWDELCREITLANLERKPDGTPRLKSLVLPHGKAKITSSSGGPKVADAEALLAHISERFAAGDCPDGLADAVRVQVEFAGVPALEVAAVDPDAKVRVLSTPVKAYVAGLDEAEQLQVPGVEIEPPSERWSFE